nr:L446 [uncultured bacterium]
MSHILRVADKFAFANKLAVVPASSAPLKGFIETAGFQVIANDDPSAGLSLSLQLGIAASGDAVAVLVLLADMPLITESHLDRLLKAYDPVVGCVASSLQGVGQPPALIGRKHFKGLASLNGDQGARDLIRNGQLIETEADLLTDIDEPETLERLNLAKNAMPYGTEGVGQ